VRARRLSRFSGPNAIAEADLLHCYIEGVVSIGHEGHDRLFQ
jgi:hypothetical protein